MMSSTRRTSSSAMLAERSFMIRTRPDDSVAGAAVGADLHEVDPQRERDLAHQVGHERQRALEDADQRQVAAGVVGARSGGRARRPWRRSPPRSAGPPRCRPGDRRCGSSAGRRCLHVGSELGFGAMIARPDAPAHGGPGVSRGRRDRRPVAGERPRPAARPLASPCGRRRRPRRRPRTPAGDAPAAGISVDLRRVLDRTGIRRGRAPRSGICIRRGRGRRGRARGDGRCAGAWPGRWCRSGRPAAPSART